MNKCQAWKPNVLSIATTSMDEITSVPLGLKAWPVCAARPGLHWASCPGACVTCYHPVLAFITAVTNYHKLSSLKQHPFTISQFHRSEVQQGLTGLKSRCPQAAFLAGSSGENLL